MRLFLKLILSSVPGLLRYYIIHVIAEKPRKQSQKHKNVYNECSQSSKSAFINISASAIIITEIINLKQHPDITANTLCSNNKIYYIGKIRGFT